MVRNYLVERKRKLEEAIDFDSNRYEHNEIAIQKNESQIKELLNEVDEATNIFSVVAREDSGFKSKEISEIEGKIAIYQSENIELDRVISHAKQELDMVNSCLEELNSNKIDSLKDYDGCQKCDDEDFAEEKEFKEDIVISNDIIEKLKLCRSLVGVDPRRTAIELDNLIKKYQ